MTEIEVLDPATVRPIAAVEDMDETTVDAAVRRARAAFDNGGGWWPGTPDEERGRVLARAAELVRAQADRLARLESLDVGKPIAEAQGDVDEAARILEYYAGWPTKAAGDSYADLGRALRAARVIRAGVVWIKLTDRAGAGHLGRVQTVRYRPRTRSSWVGGLCGGQAHLPQPCVSALPGCGSAPTWCACDARAVDSCQPPINFCHRN
jgi:hypothetical protein